MNYLAKLKEITYGLNILLVDDNEGVRNGMFNTLEKFFNKDHIFTASNGKEAFSIFQKESIDILFTDINMPVMNGFELITKIKEETNRECGIIAFTGYSDLEFMYKLINYGIDGYIKKPTEHKVLAEVFYKISKQIVNKKLVEEYREVDIVTQKCIERKNLVITQKFNELANMKNQAAGIESTVVEYVNTLDDQKVFMFDQALTNLNNYILELSDKKNFEIKTIHHLSHTFGSIAELIGKNEYFMEIHSKLNELKETILKVPDHLKIQIVDMGVSFESLSVSLEILKSHITTSGEKNPTLYNLVIIDELNQIINCLENIKD